MVYWEWGQEGKAWGKRVSVGDLVVELGLCGENG